MYKNTDNPQNSVANIDALMINLFACKILQFITNNPMTAEAIEYSTAIPAPAISSILKTLEQEGFVLSDSIETS
ncbi:hypothetical protein CR161_08705 [Prosthecochloris sp. ZM]|uniref:winged helix-turn-helix domain-containing protein n=1 Tax=Prosthecochloris sp. ZM TaxID=2283143 RepID=UPI000DF758C7|nr:winged helix-turn-helix domain-containing protein [Prosthecochloris sp. ZM]RDD30777.1 hypothetical protein CR161_08705 [Prosthecochloris sp. ZM]